MTVCKKLRGCKLLIWFSNCIQLEYQIKKITIGIFPKFRYLTVHNMFIDYYVNTFEIVRLILLCTYYLKVLLDFILVVSKILNVLI